MSPKIAPRPPAQASARPSFEVRHARRRGRDVGFRLRQAYGATSWVESGFRPIVGASRRYAHLPIRPHAPLPRRVQHLIPAIRSAFFRVRPESLVHG